MAWTNSGFGAWPGGVVGVISEEVTGVGTKTLVWGTDGATFLPGIALSYPALLLGFRLEFTATATVGNRLMTIRLTDSADDLLTEFFDQTSGAVTAGNSANIEGYDLGSGGFGTDPRYDRYYQGVYVCPGQKVVCTQTSIIDAADTLVVHARFLVKL